MRRLPWIVAAAALALVAIVVVLAVVLSPRSPEPHPAALPVAAVPLAPGADSRLDTMADPDWAAEVAAATGIPERALVSYGGAAWAMSQIQPDCHLGWTTLAAIGAVESDHGRHGGSALDADGRAEPVILGPVLDGRGQGEVRDTDAGALDGNTTWDRAVGPMQFIPSSWASWQVDADIDGAADPNDLDDAAFAAAGYLCRAGDLGDLRDVDRWRQAIGAYNASEAYIDLVAETANRYAAAVDDRTMSSNGSGVLR